MTVTQIKKLLEVIETPILLELQKQYEKDPDAANNIIAIKELLQERNK